MTKNGGAAPSDPFGHLPYGFAFLDDIRDGRLKWLGHRL